MSKPDTNYEKNEVKDTEDCSEFALEPAKASASNAVVVTDAVVVEEKETVETDMPYSIAK